jgi:AraC family transcriptional regulator of adaptative response / DNA-3-methyladenine glycosylase II
VSYTCGVDFEATYLAVESRDARFDGRVFVGVLSTGVYCRPICPAPMPRRDRVEFFPTAAAAEEHGFRACRRCRPESSPDSPDWDIRADLVGRGLRLIADGVLERDGVEGLARRLAVGSRHLRRSFVDELGAGPLSIARSRRARLAKQLLEQTELASTEVAFASGFASLRAYNDTMRRTFGRSPTEIRAARRRGDPGSGTISLRLGYRPPFAADALLSFLAARAVPGLEFVEAGTYRRAIRTADGSPAVISLTPHPTEHFVTLDVAVEQVPALTGVVQAARRAFDLDADPAAVDLVLARDPILRSLVRRTPGIRLPGTVDGFELTVRAVLGQQVSVAAARTLAGRLVRRLGSPIDRTDDEVTHLFPTPEQLAEGSLDRLGLASGRAETLRTIAELVALEKLDLTGSADVADTLRVLEQVPGVGSWTSAYVAMRALRDPDAFLATDLGVRRALGDGGVSGAPAIRASADRWRPWRGYAVMHLWHAES